MTSLQGCCCVSPPPASLSATDVTVEGVDEVPDRVPSVSVHDMMDWCGEHGSPTKVARKSSGSSVGRVHKKFSVLDSIDVDDSVFVTDLASTILVLYCGGTIGMRSKQGGMDHTEQIV